MPSTGMPSASLASMSPTPPVTPCSGGSCPHVVGQQHFATGDRDHVVDADFGDRPLVGHREHPHLTDLVTPELHPHRVFGGRCEDVENASADREFAPSTDHVHPGVGQLD